MRVSMLIVPAHSAEIAFSSFCFVAHCPRPYLFFDLFSILALLVCLIIVAPARAVSFVRAISRTPYRTPLGSGSLHIPPL